MLEQPGRLLSEAKYALTTPTGRTAITSAPSSSTRARPDVEQRHRWGRTELGERHVSVRQDRRGQRGQDGPKVGDAVESCEVRLRDRRHHLPGGVADHADDAVGQRGATAA
ncbi:hypothetical protein [Nonomuraea solani]|uniref:hypothetical protein n=1 Tax=Nonomuraea solani TaxID=1144553 RepID=UPI000CDF1E95|nr:hypothetical protein [Nonomuraea solani]